VIEQFEQQLATLWRLANKTGRAPEIEDHVKRHLRIMRQKPEIGRLGMAIANIEAAIIEYKQAVASGSHVEPEEMAKLSEEMVNIATRSEDVRQRQEGGGNAGSEGTAGTDSIAAGAERAAGGSAGAAAGAG
jgi:hypothetical protein